MSGAPTLSTRELAIRYIACAIAATIANLGAQALCFQVYYGPGAVFGALVIGTGVGLVMKYILDKRFIFFDTDASTAGNAKKFGLYSLIGLGTTVIFWGTEAAFYVMFSDPMMKYVGGALGLAIGYTVKYQLDARFVFQSARVSADAPS